MVLMLAVGVISSRFIRDPADYWIAGGRFGWPLGGAGMAATQMSAGLYIGTIGLMYTVGWSFAWVVIVFPISYWLMTVYIAPKFKRFGQFTLPDYIGHRYYSHAARLVAVLVIVISYVVYIMAQIKAGGMIAQSLVGISSEAGMIAFTIFLMGYVFIGGIIAETVSDFIQMMIMLLGGFVAIPLALRHTGGLDALMATVHAQAPKMFTWEAMPPALLFSMALAFFLGAFGRPEQLARFYMIRDVPSIRWAIGFCNVLVGLAHFSVFVLAFAARGLFPVLPVGDMAMPSVANHVLPPILGGVLVSALAAAMMSTVDSLMLVAGAAIGNDVYAKVLNPKASEQSKLLVGRISTLVMGLIPLGLLLLGLGGGQLIQIIVALFSAIVGSAFAVPVVTGLVWRRATREGAIASMVGGLITCFWWQLRPPQTIFGLPGGTIFPVVPGIVVAAILMVVVSLATPAPPEPALAPFFPGRSAERNAGTGPSA